MKQSDIDNIFIYWIYFVSLIFIALFVVESIGYISNLFEADISYISSLIFIIFNFYLIQCGYYLYKLRDAVFTIDTNNSSISNNIFLDISSEYLKLSDNNDNQENLKDDFKSKLYEFVDNGFFISDLLLKLGIIGTVIGFIIMLSSLSAIDEMNLSKMNNLLLSMSAGMKVALYTTLTGLVASILLTIQYNFFETKINIFISKVFNSERHEKKE